MTRREMIDLLCKARNLLHKQEKGEQLTRLDITLSHDYVDMVIDDLVYQEHQLKVADEELQQMKEIDLWILTH